MQNAPYLRRSACVCLFSSLYLPSIGGVETYTASIAQAFLKMEMRVIVVCCATHTPIGRTVENDIEIVRLPCIALLHGRYPVPKNNSAAKALWEWLFQQDIDFIEIHTRFYPLSIKALEFSKIKNIIPVLLEHGSAHLTMGNQIIDAGVKVVEHAMTKLCLRYPAAYYAVSQKSSAWLNHFGIVSEGELPNSIDADAYFNSASSRNFRDELAIDESSLLAVFVGRLVPEKGVLELARAANDLGDIPAVVALGGDGPLERELRGYEGVHFRLLGRLDRPDVAALLCQADVSVLPSRSEGFATSLLEAAACHTPSLVTPVGGTDELIPNDSFGTLLDNMEAGTIKNALIAAADSKDSLLSQGKNAAMQVREKFTWSSTAQKTVSAFQNAQTSEHLQ